MEVIKPIPKKLLPHRAKLAKERTDSWGTGEEEEGKDLIHIRVEPSSKVVRDKNNAELQLAALLFFDCKNSRPEKQVFAEDEIVAFGGLKYRIVTIEALHDGKNCHHYEIGMVRYAGKHENEDTRTSGD